jgi:hypothetical protein
MKITRKMLRDIITEELASVQAKSRLSPDSADDQIDGMLIRYEEQSIIEEHMLSSLKLLFEAEPEKDAPPEDAAPEESGAPPEEEDIAPSSKDVEIDNPATAQTPKIDVDKFSMHIARLVQNYSRLLDIPTVIMGRARNFLEENYSKAVADEYEESLDRNHGLELNPKDNIPERPPAVGAGPG